MEKRCSKCGEIKKLTEFYKSKTYKDGLGYICKKCDKRGSAERIKQNVELRNKKDYKLITIKKCSGCGELKFICEFRKQSSNKDGFTSRCKSCISKNLKECKERKIKLRKEDNYVPIISKKCRSCGKVKKIDCFTINRLTKDSFSYNCKPCEQIYGKKRREKICLLKENDRCKIITEKKCSKCGKIKKVSEFYKNKCSKDDYNAYCKECAASYSKVYRIENKEVISIKGINYCKKNKEKISLKSKEYQRRNKNRISLKNKQYYEENKNTVALQEKHYKNSNAKYKTYAEKLTVDEFSRIYKDGESLEVLCKYCGKYFVPLVKAIISRVRSLNGIAGGDQYLYCSENCKQSCPTYGRVKYPKGFKKQTSREVNPLIRQMCFKRDNWECQICGKSTGEVQLHCHHIEGYAQNPRLGNDIENVITLCKECHKEVHSEVGCRYTDLRCK